MVWFWIVIMILSLLLEMFRPKLLYVFITISSLFSLILAIVEMHILIQIGTFAVVLTLLMTSLRPVLIRRIEKKHFDFNFEDLIGQSGIVVSSGNEHRPVWIKVGKIKCRAIANCNLKKGDVVKIIDIAGLDVVIALD